MNSKSWVEVDELETTRVEVDVAQVVTVAVESKTAAESKATHKGPEGCGEANKFERTVVDPNADV